MEFKLVKPTFELEKEYYDYIHEWYKSNEKIIPYYSSIRNNLNYKTLINDWKEQTTSKVYQKGLVPSSIYFLIDKKNKIYGCLHIRHELNDYLLKYGGHIAYGIRPSERRKGYATQMLSLSLPIAYSLGIHKILITCDKKNIASSKVIINNFGRLENEITQNTKVIQRYWIEN